MGNDRKQMLTVQFIVLSLFTLLIITAACNQSQARSRAQSPPSPSPASTPTSALPSELEIVQHEFSLEHSVSTVKAGEVTFAIKNDGFIEHNFIIEGVDSKIDVILPQEATTFTVNLSPGTYRLVCNLPGHEEAGMVSEIKVE